MRACILNSLTKEIENIIVLDSYENFIPYKEGIELAPRHDGEFDWTWSKDLDDWVKPIKHEPTEDELAQTIRNKRQRFFSRYVDTINGPRWEMMPETAKQEFMTYRQALLDITIQPNFPYDIVWPTVPNFP